MGRRLNRFSHAAVCAIAYQIGSPVVIAASHAAIAEPSPQIGPAKPTRASSPTLPGYCFIRTNRAEERNEHRRAGRDVVLAQRHHVPHLVDVDATSRSPARIASRTIDQYTAKNASMLAKVLSLVSPSRSSLNFDSVINRNVPTGPSLASHFFQTFFVGELKIDVFDAGFCEAVFLGIRWNQFQRLRPRPVVRPANRGLGQPAWHALPALQTPAAG